MASRDLRQYFSPATIPRWLTKTPGRAFVLFLPLWPRSQAAR